MDHSQHLSFLIYIEDCFERIAQDWIQTWALSSLPTVLQPLILDCWFICHSWAVFNPIFIVKKA